jgi:MFS family permease
MALKLPRTVVVLGLVSFFNDLASEIVVPLIPILLAGVLAAGPIALGLVEGVADAVASFIKLWSGRHSDLLGGRRKGLTLAGYALSNLARPLLGLAGGWGTVLLLRSIDRVGKGLRTAPRDALISDATPPRLRGYAYGFQRALDNGGAVGGSLLAAAVLAWSTASLSQVILLSAIPGFLAVLCLAIGVKTSPPKVAPSAAGLLLEAAPPLAWTLLSGSMRRYLGVLALFALARASETFILLLGHERGAATVELLLLWAVLNLSKAATSTIGGRLSDRFGRGAVIVVSWSAFALSFALLGAAHGPLALWLATILYGLLAGAGEGAERAVVADFARPAERGTAFGWYNLVAGMAAIPSGLLFGALWQYAGAAVAFGTAAALAAAAALLLAVWAWPRPSDAGRLSA